jgi:4'-phosphopantetheinyl transferase
MSGGDGRDAPLPDLAKVAAQALALCGFVPPDAGETCVLLCDSAVWAPHVASVEALLDATERARAASFRFEHDRSTYVLAHGLWRVALGACLGLEASRVTFASTPAGQPQLPGTGLATSLSHSGTWLAIAISADRTVGIDIERSPHTGIEQLMSKICTPAELVDLQPLPGLARQRALLALWTRKEALLKAFGVGLAVEPASLSAMTNGPIEPPPLSSTDHAPCRVIDLDLPAALVGALAIPMSVSAIRLSWLNSAAGP